MTATALPHISHEVPRRWIQRVDPELTMDEAWESAQRFLDTAVATKEVPTWLGGCQDGEARRFWHSPVWPGVVGIERERTLKTVVCNRKPGQSRRVGASVRFVGLEGLTGRELSDAAKARLSAQESV